MKYVCDACGWEYDPAEGVPELGIEPGTEFEDLPEDFVCPQCGVVKNSLLRKTSNRNQLRYPALMGIMTGSA